MLWRSAAKLLAPGGAIRIDAPLCVRTRYSPSRCSACADVCPENAIEISLVPQLNAGTCTSCRQCEAACPACAIADDEPNLRELAEQLAKHPLPVLGCRVPGVQANVHSGCLGFLDSEALLALGMALPAGLTLNLKRCKDCVNAPVMAKVEAAAQAARHLAVVMGAGPVHVAIDPRELAVKESGISRREFLSLAGRRAAQAVSSAVKSRRISPLEPMGERKDLPARRRLLLEKFGLIKADIRTSVAGVLFPSLDFGLACTNCMGCVGMCPTGAIATSRHDPPRPAFIAPLCTNCGVCAEYCAAKAITLKQPAFLEKSGNTTSAQTPASSGQ
jgi:ferredoxin